MTGTVLVANDPDHARFVATVDGVAAGSTLYSDAPGVRTFVHTKVDPAFEGHGVGGALARAALDDARASGRRVVARCPFIAAWIDRHPDYADLLARS